MAIFACYNNQIANGAECAIVSAPTAEDAAVQAREALEAAGRPSEIVGEPELLELPHVCELA